MKIYGYEPTEDQLNEAIEYMKSSTNFRAKDIEGILINADVPEMQVLNGTSFYIAMRVTDRLIQKLRKEGKIELEFYQTWKWIDI